MGTGKEEEVGGCLFVLERQKYNVKSSTKLGDYVFTRGEWAQLRRSAGAREFCLYELTVNKARAFKILTDHFRCLG